ncbi:MAG TPA: sulfotransferase [Thermoanaerobaculia bacterium]|nr:sulfotransferase [Thermoanaerobaculia bacterium]
MDSCTDPLFILSCHRSGSTLLRFALDTHPAIYSPPELFLGTAAFQLATFLSGLNGQVFKKEDLGTPRCREILEQTRQILAGQLALQTARRGKRLWCEKTPDNIEYLELIDALFPNARYLCLYRHGLDVARSGTGMSFPALLPFLYASRGHMVTALLRYWTEWNGQLLRFAAERPGRCHRLSYEDLVLAPSATLDALFSFLGLDWDERLVDSIFSARHDAGVEDFKVRQVKTIHRDSLGLGRDLSLSGVPEKALEAMRRLLAELGYPPLPERGGVPASPAWPQVTEPAGPTVEWLFDEHLPTLFRDQPRLADALGFSYQVVITGEGGGLWVVDLHEGEALVLAGRLPAPCTIHMEAADLRELMAGRLSPLAALADGRIRIEGTLNQESLQHLLELFQQAPVGAGQI